MIRRLGRGGGLFTGMAAAILTMLLLFVTTAGFYGIEDMEQGLWISIVLWVSGILSGYLLGALMITCLSWVSKRLGMPIAPNYVAFGFLLSALMWLSTEITLVDRLRARFMSEFMGFLASIVLASLVVLVAGHGGRHPSTRE